MSITGWQCRAARNALGWSLGALAEKTALAERTISDFEREVRTPQKSTLNLLRTTLEATGIEFIDENGGGPGIRLAKISGPV